MPLRPIAASGRNPEARYPGCRVRRARKESLPRCLRAEGGPPMSTHIASPAAESAAARPFFVPSPPRVQELDRLGDEIAELSAHLDAATARNGWRGGSACRLELPGSTCASRTPLRRCRD